MYEVFKLGVMAFVLPPGGPIVLVVTGVLLLRHRPRVGRQFAVMGALALWLSSLPIVATLLVTFLGGGRPVDLAEAAKADAIVILGGGVRLGAVEFGGDTLGRLTLERVRYGAYIARRTGLPVLVSGGAPRNAVRTEAELMGEAMVEEFGVSVRWMDDKARNTRENAVNSARLLRADGKRRVVLVMHGFDVKRARSLFEDAGLEVIAAPTQVTRGEELGLSDFLPSAAAMSTAHFAVYEAMALIRNSLCP